MLRKGRHIYVSAFEPGDGTADSAVGGFEWRTTPEEAKVALIEWLMVETVFDCTYLIRRVTLPNDFADTDAVTAWLDGAGRYLWETALESGAS